LAESAAPDLQFWEKQAFRALKGKSEPGTAADMKRFRLTADDACI